MYNYSHIKQRETKKMFTQTNLIEFDSSILQHKPSVGVKRNIKIVLKNSTNMRPSTYVHALFYGWS
jgi:hypothetical protein